jgi:hypothetical protein
MLDGRTRPRWMLAVIPRRPGISDAVCFNFAYHVPWTALVVVVLLILLIRWNN